MHNPPYRLQTNSEWGGGTHLSGSSLKSSSVLSCCVPLHCLELGGGGPMEQHMGGRCLPIFLLSYWPTCQHRCKSAREMHVWLLIRTRIGPCGNVPAKISHGRRLDRRNACGEVARASLFHLYPLLLFTWRMENVLENVLMKRFFRCSNSFQQRKLPLN